MSEIVGSTAGLPSAPAEPHALRSTTDGELTAAGVSPAAGRALAIRPAVAADLRHNAGWLTVWQAAHEGTRAVGWFARGVLALLALMLGAAGWLVVKIPKGIGILATLTLDLGKFIAVGFALFIVFQAVREPARVIDPIAVTSELTGRVRDGRQLTAVIVENLANYDYLVRQVWNDKESRALDKPPQILEVQLPGAQISLRQVVDAIRTSFGASDRRLTGQLMLAPRTTLSKCGDGTERRLLVLRISAEADGFVFEASEPVCFNQANAAAQAEARLLADASAAILRATNPCGAAAYYYSQKARDTQGRLIDPQLDTALRMIEVCVSQVSQSDSARANHLKGLILQARARAIVDRMPADEGGRAAQLIRLQALESFKVARDAFEASLWNRMVQMFWRSDFLPTLLVHRGDVLLDIGPDPDKIKSDGSDANYITQVVTTYESARDGDGRHMYAWLGLARALHAEMLRNPDLGLEQRADFLVASLCATISGLDRRPDAAALYHHKAVVLDDYVRLRWPNGNDDGAARVATAWSLGRLPPHTSRHCADGNAFLVRMTLDAVRQEAVQMHERAAAFEPRNPEYTLVWADILARRAAASGKLLDAVRAIDAYRQARDNAEARRESTFRAWDGEGLMQLVAERPGEARDVWRAALRVFRGQAEDRDNALGAGLYFRSRVALLVPDLNLAEALLINVRRLSPQLVEAERLLTCVRELQVQAAASTVVAGAASQLSPTERLRLQCLVGLPDG